MTELEKEIARFQAWEREKARYLLTDFGGQTYAYLLKPESADGEPSHRICANCCQSGHKSILQFLSHSAEGQDWFKCPRCRSDQAFGVRVPNKPNRIRVPGGLAL